MRAVKARLADGSPTTYWYCRLTNTRLPAPDDPSFAAALAAARRPQVPRLERGTLGHLLAQWRASAEYDGLARRTKENRNRYLRAVEAPVWAGKPVASVTRAELLEMRDAIARGHGPAAANMFAQSVSSVLAWGVDRGHLPYNPLARAKALAGGHFLAWEEHEATRAMAEFLEPQRRAVVLAYHIGQRRGDLAAMTWTAYDGEAITLMPEKTRRRREAKGLGPLRLPVHPELRAELAAWQAENVARQTPALTILTGPSGRGWGREALNQAIQREVTRLQLRPGLNIHGFRKLAASRLAEAGATTSEIAAALGWETLQHVELYTRGANQARLATAAVLRLSNGLANAGKDGKTRLKSTS